ncbi:MAG TPA: GMP synthase, partial [Pseudomonas sp.]|nr:GMP synthase [Pseudomonas sp.]
RQWLGDWSHLLDPSEPSQQSLDTMLSNLQQRVRDLNRTAEGFYRHWLAMMAA